MTLPAESVPDASTGPPHGEARPVYPSAESEPLDTEPPNTEGLAMAGPVTAATEGEARRTLSLPAAFILVVTVSALVLIGCVLAATVGLLFGNWSSSERATPIHTVFDPSRPPLSSFRDGQWLVVRDIVPGTYQTTVPAESPGCSWERNASTDGTASSVLESGAGPGGAELAVTIKETDAVFQSSGCGVWQLVPAGHAPS